MARWTKNKVNPDDINNGNEYEIKDRPSREQLNLIVNNSLYASEASAEALEKANSAFMANGTVARVNGTPQAFLDFDEEPQQQITGVKLNQSSLIAEAIASGTESSIIFENLDALADGETYDFEVSCGLTSPNVWLKINDNGLSSCGYSQFGISGNWGDTTYLGFSSRAVQGILIGNIYNGAMFINGSIKQHSNFNISVICQSESGNTTGASSQRHLITCGYINNSSNITKIEFFAEQNTYVPDNTFKAGTKIRIYKRATNAPTRG